MRIFVTGASGHVASAVIPELAAHGHAVTGLARSAASATRVAALGADVRHGDLTDLAVLSAAADEADAVVHLAYDHAQMNSGALAEVMAQDLAALEALAAPLVGTDKALVGTSAILVLAGEGVAERPGTEADVASDGPRTASENYVVGLAERGVRSSVVRVAPLVHSDLDHHGFTPSLVGFARDRGAAGYIGEGANHWSAIDTRDLAALYRLAVERAPAGSRLHGAADTALPFRTVAETVAGLVGVPTRSVTPEQAPGLLGFLADFAGLDVPVSNDRTRDLLGWEPVRPGWVEDVRSGHYLP